MSKEKYLARAVHPGLDGYVDLGIVEGTYEDAWVEAYGRALKSDCEADSIELAPYDGKRLYKIDWSFYMREGQKKARVHKSNTIKAMCVQEACNRLYQEEVQYLHFTTVDNISIWDPFTETFKLIFDEEAEED